MADVFATVVTPDAYKADALVMAQGSMAFSAGFTTDPSGTPPVTHWLASGYIPEEIRDAFANDARFTVSDQPWRTVAESMGLVRVIAA